MRTIRVMLLILIACFGLLILGSHAEQDAAPPPSADAQETRADAQEAEEPDPPPLAVQQTAIDRITSLPPVIFPEHRKLTQYLPIQAELADIPSAADMRTRFRPELSRKQFQYYLNNIRERLQDRWITADTRNNLVTIRDWPYFKVSSVVTKYQVENYVIQIRDNNLNTVIVISTSPGTVSKVYPDRESLAQRVVELHQLFIRPSPSQQPVTIENVLNSKHGKFALMPDGKTGELWGRINGTNYWSDGDTLYVRRLKANTHRGFRLKSAGSIAKGLLPPSPPPEPVTNSDDSPQPTVDEPVEVRSDEELTEEEKKNAAN